jgi:hypothetical protein
MDSFTFLLFYVKTNIILHFVYLLYFGYFVLFHVKSNMFFLYFPQKLVQKLEGFKQISWKEDQETDNVHNFTFNTPELSMRNLCPKGAVETEPSEKPSADVLPEPVVDCTAKSGSCPMTTTTFENETSENESEVGNTEQCGDVCSHGMLEGTSNRVSVATDEITAGSESTSGITESINSCVTLETGNIVGNLLPNSQTSLPESTKVSEMPRVKDKHAEYCGTLNEMNFPVDVTQGIAAQHYLMPPKFGCSTVVQNDNRTQDCHLNDTFVLPRTSPSYCQIKTPGRLVQKRSIQSKVNTGNK